MSLFAQKLNIYGAKEQGIGELSSYLINQFAQDSYGFVWIATDYGLNKYDGIRVTHYFSNEKDSLSLLGNNVRTLLVDKENTLWVGCNKGLQYYNANANCFEAVVFPNNISLHVASIVQLHDGEILVATGGRGVFSIDKKTRTATRLDHITELTGAFVDYLYEDKSNYLWFATENKGLIKLNPLTFETKTYQFPNNAVTSMVEDDEGRLYASASTFVCVYDKITQKFQTLAQANNEPLNVTNLVLTRSGIIYVSTNGKGLYYIDSQTNRLIPVPYLNRVNSYYYYSRITALMEDRDQNLWLGCLLKGILMIPNEPTQFNSLEIAAKENSKGNIINSVLKDSDGNVFYSAEGDGIYKLNRQHKIENHFDGVKDIIKLYEDSHKTLWVSSYSAGLAKMDKNTGHLSFMDIPHNSFAKTMTEGQDGSLYVSTFSSGFIRYNLNGGDWKRYGMKLKTADKGGLDNDWINYILCDSEGLIWLGHYSGISCFDPSSNSFLEVRDKEKLSNQICISLMEGDHGDIWIGTYNGLFCLNKKNGLAKTYSTEEGLSSNVICGLAKDSSGNIWCSTFQGLNKIIVKEDKIVNYYMGNGLIDRIYNRWVYFQDSDGVIYFGGNNGITYFQPEDISMPAEYNYNILTTNVYIDNNIPVGMSRLSGKNRIADDGVLNADEFRFPFEDNTFTFEFSTMDFRDPENISFEYRMKGLDREWFSTLPGMNQVAYHNMSPGKYTLEVRASKFNVYSQVKRLSIVVSPPWYKSFWAYVVYLLLFAFIGLLVFNLIRKKRTEQENESRLQYFTNISHELRSPLTLLVSPLEKLLQGNYDENTMKTLRGMHRNTNRLLALVNQILDIRKIDKGQMRLKYAETEMVGFVKDVLVIFEDQAAKRNIRFGFEHQLESLFAWVDRNNFDKILINLLSNAFKFTPDGGEISVSLNRGQNEEGKPPSNRYFEIAITDSGKGLEEDKIDKIFERFYQGQNLQAFTTVGSGIGLNLTRYLVQLHHGTIVAGNRKDTQGSYFKVRMPLGKGHLRREDFAAVTASSRPILEQNSYLKETKPMEKNAKRKTTFKLLIVDDEEEIRNYLKQELEETYKITQAADGLEALQMALNQQPDIIISDIMMPQMDGFALLKKIKSNQATSHIPIVLLTSKTEFQDKINALDKGADAYITKPFNLEELQITIGNLITNRRILKGKFSGDQQQEERMKTIDIKSADDTLMERVMKIINENLGNPELNVELLASKAGFSRVQLHRKMKKITGLTTSDFIRNIRMKHAATLLREKKVDVASVAYVVGFVNQSHFSTAFKKFYGVKPSEYAVQIGDAEELPDNKPRE